MSRKSHFFINGQCHSTQGSAATQELAIDNHIIVPKYLGDNDVSYEAASDDKKKTMLEQVELAGTELGYREVTTDIIAKAYNPQSVPKTLSVLVKEHGFLGSAYKVNKFPKTVCPPSIAPLLQKQLK